MIKIIFHIFCYFYLTEYDIIQSYFDVNIWPQSQKVFVNSTALIYCNSFVLPKWTYRNDVLNVTSNILLINPVRHDHGGVYMCHGRTKVGKFFNAKSMINIEVSLIIKIISHFLAVR